MPLPYAPTVYFAELTQAQKESVLQEVAKEAASRFKNYRASIKEGVGMPNLDATERLEAYRTRQPDVWARLQSGFPQEYSRQQKDWGRLEANEYRKPSVRILQSASEKTTRYEGDIREAE